MNVDKLLLNQGKLLSNRQYGSSVQTLADVEFSIFSQFQDDGIIQFLIKKVAPISPYFIEFGVENYLESNTRFLMQNNNWSGLIFDGNSNNIESVKKSYFFWKHDLLAYQAFVTKENINTLLETHLPNKDIGLLHIDIDGNDYWIWREISVVQPPIVIVEYNSVFGCDRAITIPYSPDFVRTNHHTSNLYAGCSLLALCDLAEEKGYYFIGSNSAGNNAYFVRKEFVGDLKVLSAQEGYVESRFRESRDEKGRLTFLRGTQRLEAIKGMKVFNTRTNEIEYL